MIYIEFFLGFLKVGCFAFGGAYGAIPLMIIRRTLVTLVVSKAILLENKTYVW